MTQEPVGPARRCGCPDYDCHCVVEGTGEVTVIGTGDTDNPYEFLLNAAIALEIVDTPSVDLTLTGSGIAADPFVLSGTADVVAPSQTIFLTDGVYNIPATASLLRISAIGAGGGGSGTVGATPPGGNGGGLSEISLSTDGLNTALAVTVGQGGPGRPVRSTAPPVSPPTCWCAPTGGSVADRADPSRSPPSREECRVTRTLPSLLLREAMAALPPRPVETWCADPPQEEPRGPVVTRTPAAVVARVPVPVEMVPCTAAVVVAPVRPRPPVAPVPTASS
jgi:hypothetical protein